MGIRDLQEFVETHCQQACKHVDLVQVARGFSLQSRNSKKRLGVTEHQLRLVVDAESCLHKLYGGFYSDWASGGQWNRMMSFLNNLVHTCRASNLELVVFFNGALEGERMDEWFQQQADIYTNIQGVIRHVYHKATPPPKAWWVPPPMLSSCIRLALRQLGISVACSMDDHHQEVIAYCREYNLHGVLAQDADYAVFDPPRYFSAHHLKLTFRGSLETQEYLIDDLAKAIDLNPKRFSILAALLGTHLLPEADLREFFCRICHLTSPAQVAQYPYSEIIKAVINYVRSLTSVDDLDAIGMTVFKNCLGNINDKVNRFKQSVQYYVNGTKEGFFKYRPKIQVTTPVKQPGSYPSTGSSKITSCSTNQETATKNGSSLEGNMSSELFKMDELYVHDRSGYNCSSTSLLTSSSALLDSTVLVSHFTQNELNLEAAAALSSSASAQPGARDQQQNVECAVNEVGKTDVTAATACATTSTSMTATSCSNGSGPQKVVSASGALASVRSPSAAAAQTHLVRSPSAAAAQSHMIKTDLLLLNEKISGARLRLISPEVMNIASERHQKGLMFPWVYQILSQKEIKLSISLEDEAYRDLPLAIDLYRPLRQRVYSVLTDLSSQITQWKLQKNGDKTSKPHVSIKEWVIPRGGTKVGNRPCCDTVVAEPLDWTVPDLQRLWLGTTTEDKSYRLKTFLSCMKCDMPQNMLLNTAYVPQQFIILCCVLRYIIMYKKVQVLRPYELDAFLATAVSPLLHDVDAIQEMQLPQLKVRGLHLASLFMVGVEHAIFVNDAVGAPIPWGVTCPWLFFDGKLFHMKLLKTSSNISLIDLCDGHAEQAMFVEKMRTAILNGIPMESAFALPSMMMPFPRPPFSGYPQLPHHSYSMHPAGETAVPYEDHGRGGRSTLGFGPVDTRGGQLQIAGVVVGSWGANTKIQQYHYGNENVQESQPYITSIGPYRGAPRSMECQVNRSYNVKKQSGFGKMHNSVMKLSYEQQLKPTAGRGRGCTVELPSEEGCISAPVIQLMKNSHQATNAGQSLLGNGQEELPITTDATAFDDDIDLPPLVMADNECEDDQAKSQGICSSIPNATDNPITQGRPPQQEEQRQFTALPSVIIGHLTDTVKAAD